MSDTKTDPNFAPLLAIGKAARQAWKPSAALTANQAVLRVVRFEGHFSQLHSHDVDECYVVLDGELVVEIEGEASSLLRMGDAYVVRAGTRHRPYALPVATVLLIT
ncbi:MAG: cupin domain-containing protein [Polyangiaceae bacterium]